VFYETDISAAAWRNCVVGFSDGQTESPAAADPLIEGFRLVEVASVSDAMEQLYKQRAYMSHEMRALSTAKFAGPAVTVLLKKEEHQEGSKASEGCWTQSTTPNRDRST